MLRRMVRPESIPPGRGDAALVRETAVQGVGEPAQRLLQLHPLVLADPVDLRDGALTRLDDPLLQCEQRLQVPLDRLGQPGEDAGEPAAQRHRVVLGALVPDLVLDVVEPAQQRLLLGDGQVGVDLRALLLADLARGACVGEMVGLDLHPVALALHALVVLGEHDLLGHRGQVDLVGLLVEVVLLGEVLGVEVVADVDRLAVAVPLLPVLAGLLGQREVLKHADVGEVFVAVPVAVPGLRRPDLHQCEEPVEGTFVEDLLVAPVLDQRAAQGGLEVGLVGEHPRLAGTGHGVEGLGDRDPRGPGAAAVAVRTGAARSPSALPASASMQRKRRCAAVRAPNGGMRPGPHARAEHSGLVPRSRSSGAALGASELS